MLVLARIICLIGGYFFGIIQTSYIYGKLHGIDIREYGSGNAGTTNALRVLGKKAGAVVFLGDLFKSVIACSVTHIIMNALGIENVYLFVIYTAAGVVLGHNFPFYLNFKGGKGIAATSGIVLGLLFYPTHCWAFAVLGALTFGLVTYFSKYVSLGSLMGIGMWFVEFVIWGCVGWLPLSGSVLYECYGVVFIITLLGFIQHRGNIKRLINGTERKVGQKRTEEVK